MRIGVVSDTHGYFDPQLPTFLKGVDEILHAGDVGSMVVLDQLQAIAPVQAVRGNIDADGSELAPTVTRSFGGVEIHMLHALADPQSTLRDWARRPAGNSAEQCRRFLESLPERSQVVIFGHSHLPCALILGEKLFFNPGSAGKKRFSLPRCCGMLEFSPQGVHATFLGLERYNQDLPEGLWLTSGGVEPCGKC